MSDPRETTVADVLRENGVQTNLKDTDTLATEIVNALDREHGTPDTHEEPGGVTEHTDDARAAEPEHTDTAGDDDAGAPNA